jgi:hypothetical protein
MSLVSPNPSPLAGNSYAANGDYRGVATGMVAGEAFEIADAQAITDTDEHPYTTAVNDADGRNIEGRTSTIVVSDSHDEAGTVKIYGHPLDASDKILLYSDAILTGGGSDYFVFTPFGGGTNASASLLTVAALASPWFKITVSVTYGTGPGSGAVNIDVYTK